MIKRIGICKKSIKGSEIYLGRTCIIIKYDSNVMRILDMQENVLYFSKDYKNIDIDEYFYVLDSKNDVIDKIINLLDLKRDNYLITKDSFSGNNEILDTIIINKDLFVIKIGIVKYNHYEISAIRKIYIEIIKDNNFLYENSISFDADNVGIRKACNFIKLMCDL